MLQLCVKRGSYVGFIGDERKRFLSLDQWAPVEERLDQ